jgi:hypothetical protein
VAAVKSLPVYSISVFINYQLRRLKAAEHDTIFVNTELRSIPGLGEIDSNMHFHTAQEQAQPNRACNILIICRAQWLSKFLLHLFILTMLQLRLERNKTTLPMLDLKRPILKKETTSLNTSERRTSMFLEDKDKFTYVVALEVGTSYSGYAYAQRKDGKSIAKDIGSIFNKSYTFFMPFAPTAL